MSRLWNTFPAVEGTLVNFDLRGVTNVVQKLTFVHHIVFLC